MHLNKIKPGKPLEMIARLASGISPTLGGEAAPMPHKPSRPKILRSGRALPLRAGQGGRASGQRNFLVIIVNLVSCIFIITSIILMVATVIATVVYY